MKTIGVIGTGAMGAGIAQVLAQHGSEVIVQNRLESSVEKGLARIRKALDGLVRKEKIAKDEADGVFARIRGVVSLEDLKPCDMVIESAPEDLELKHFLFEEIDDILREDAIIATNTSSLSITKLGSFLREPERFVGMHFFNPAPVMKLVEVVRGLRTAESTVETVRTLAESLGKVPIVVNDSPGFVVNRVLFPMINEAAFALQQGVADPQGIDECMKLGCNHPLGPLALADLVGLDVVCAILESLYREYGEPRYAPCLEIKKRVEAGYVGRKAGRGFYDYKS
jgi:3-hydroxybutyryl-CoA dehydrogenase